MTLPSVVGGIAWGGITAVTAVLTGGHAYKMFAEPGQIGSLSNEDHRLLSNWDAFDTKR
jgi:hypothetical protein